MNLQALMKQAQTMQRDMMKAKDEIDQTVFTGENGFVKVEVKGTKEVIKVEIDSSEFTADDVELLQDMIVIAMNEAFKKVDQMTEEKMGKFANAMPGMF
ncbi:MAG: YbaB/EbfC family nucleoid-associated protein [Bacilli bacterium]|nr:YbaB/EbfC family nucleoid-associated protein [Bacilli bacterium]